MKKKTKEKKGKRRERERKQKKNSINGGKKDLSFVTYLHTFARSISTLAVRRLGVLSG